VDPKTLRTKLRRYGLEAKHFTDDEQQPGAIA
jgi:Fe-S-cluster formation regulator IscX/YfhJ